MIKIMSESNFNSMVKCYNLRYPKGFLDKSNKINKQLKEALVGECYIVYNELFTGFVIMFPYDNKLALNPWFLNGYPVGDSASDLLKEAIEFYEASDFERIELIGEKDFLKSKEIPLPFCYDYVNMVKTIDEVYKIDESFKHISEFDEPLLKEIYNEAFQNSDAYFYKLQSEKGKHIFWKYLNYKKALLDPCSIAIVRDDKLVAYIFSNRSDNSRHIMCMCVLPSYQHQGLGLLLLKGLNNKSKDLNDFSITLGTELNMKAYLLYKKFGFVDKTIRSYYIRKG